MSSWYIDYKELRRFLRQTHCPYRLYPERIRALEILTDRKLLWEIQKDITTPIAQQFGMMWSQQFVKDFQTYGLYEAVLYFHSYPDLSEAESFIKDVCDFYHEIAALYMAYHEKIVDNDDPLIQSQLALIRFRGEGIPQGINLPVSPFQVPGAIPPPKSPPPDPNYKRWLPINKSLKFLLSHLGPTTQPDNLAEELIEHLDSRFTFEDFPGLQVVFFETVNFLGSFGIDAFSSTGQYILSTICEHMNEEFYGDFEKWIECIRCNTYFIVNNISLEKVNACLIQGGWICEQCQTVSNEPQNNP